jgi:FMN phosphatase YigB (HAD superfamily)
MKLAFVDLDYTVLVNPMWPAVFPYFARHVCAGAASPTSERAVIDDLMRRSKALSLARDIAANDWDRLMRESAAGFGVAWDEPVDGLIERFHGHARAVAGAHEMLADLRDAGWTCVAASAGLRRFQLPTLRHLGLLACFHRLTFADDLPSPKRRRAFYGEIAEDVTHVASVGDSFVDDCLYPRHFGFATIWFTGARPSRPIRCEPGPHAQLDRLDGVVDALEAVTVKLAPLRGDACRGCGGPAEDAGGCSLCRCVSRHDEELWDGDAAPDRPPSIS